MFFIPKKADVKLSARFTVRFVPEGVAEEVGKFTLH
jgi:hypothetical protein